MRILGKKRTTDVSDDDIVKAYDQQKSAYKAATMLGIASSTIYRVLRKRGIEAIGLDEYRRGRTRFKGQEQEIRTMYESGVTHDQLREHFGHASDYALKHAIKRAGGTLRPNPTPTLKDGELDKIKALHAEGAGSAKIALAIHRSQSWVWRTMRNAGLQSPRKHGYTHGMWKGGRMKAGDYWRVKVAADDPMASMRNNQGYALEHRLVMARCAGPSLIAHRIGASYQRRSGRQPSREFATPARQAREAHCDGVPGLRVAPSGTG